MLVSLITQPALTLLWGVHHNEGAVQAQGAFPSALGTASNLTVLDISSNMLRHARGIPCFNLQALCAMECMLGIMLVRLGKGNQYCLAVAGKHSR